MHLKKKNQWADRGFKVAWGQFKMPYAVKSAAPLANDDNAPLKIDKSSDDITVRNANMDASISQETGTLQHYSFDNKNLMISPLVPNFWRATTDNDRAGWGNSLDPWKKAAQNPKVQDVSVMHSGKTHIEIMVSGTLPVGKTTYQTTYTILQNGMVKVHQTITPIGNDIPPAISKVGMTMRIPKKYNNMHWYGRGPEENYEDRKSGASVGRYSGLVDSLWTNYIYPQENANRSDVRWVAFTNSAGYGLLAVDSSTLSVSAWPYTLNDLQQATHTDELPHRNFYTVNLDYKQQGVGGTETWTKHARALPAYRLPTNRSYTYSFYLRPVTSTMNNISDIANYSFPENSTGE